MKNQLLILLSALCQTLSAACFSQEAPMQMFAIEPYPLELAVRKTTHLVFPYPIISVDRGSGDILARKAKGTDNILQVKAARTGFAQTNLTVITADGKLYGFLADYQPEPSQLSIEFIGEDITRAALSGERANLATARQLAQMVSSQHKGSASAADQNAKVRVQVDGPFVGQQMMFFRVRFTNRSHISYKVENLNFFFRERKKARRSAMQQQPIRPVYVWNDTSSVGAGGSRQMVFVFHQFTIPDQKYLAVQVKEDGGSRELMVRIPARRIRRAVPVAQGE